MIWKKNRAVTLKRNTKNACTKFHENILNGSQNVEVICQNKPQNTLKWPLEDGDMMSEKVLVIISVMSRTTAQNFMTKYWTYIKKSKYICQNSTPKNQKNGPKETGAIVWVYWPPILYQEQLYKISWKNIEWFSRNKVTWNTDKQKWLKYTPNQNPFAFFGVFDHQRNAELVPAKFQINIFSSS